MKNTKKLLLDYTLDDLRGLLGTWGEKPYRATQILEWLYKRGADSFKTMINVPPSLREKLRTEFSTPHSLTLTKKYPSNKDGTVKYLFSTHNKIPVESVFLPHEGRHTACVSTQAGCPLQCVFCASGKAGFSGNLSAGQIIGQILLILKEEKLPRVENIVFMGMGEPLLNYDECLRAVEMLNAPWGLEIAARRITISTAGIVEGIHKLAKQPKQIRLSISLHASDEKTRSALMPINKQHPLKAVLAAARQYTSDTGRRIGVEYVLVAGVNDSPQQAIRLADLVRDFAHSVNLIGLNPIEEFPGRAPAQAVQEAFRDTLISHGVKATLRQEKGGDVHAACGQLRLRSIGKIGDSHRLFNQTD